MYVMDEDNKRVVNLLLNSVRIKITCHPGSFKEMFNDCRVKIYEIQDKETDITEKILGLKEFRISRDRDIFHIIDLIKARFNTYEILKNISLDDNLD